MKYLATLFLARNALAFHVPLPRQRGFPNPLQMSAVDDAPSDMDDSASDSRQDLLDVAKSLKEEFGPLIIDSKAQEKLKSVVDVLEMNSEPPVDSADMIGDWTLLCSTSSTEKLKGIDTSQLPLFNADFVKDIRNTVNKSLLVQQKIKSGDSSSDISRVDHVIQYMPPNQLSEFVSTLPDALQNLSINPLEVTNQKVILIHKANVESTTPVIKTKLALESLVLNVAGKSQYFEPEGADVLGVNVPFGEFLNSGTFDTTYMDDELRISRSKVGAVDQLRVFIREPKVENAAAVEEVKDAEVEAPSDVEGEEADVEAPTEASKAVDDSPEEDGDEGAEAPSDVE